MSVRIGQLADVTYSNNQEIQNIKKILSEQSRSHKNSFFRVKNKSS